MEWNDESVREISNLLNDKKAQNITIIDISSKSSFADYFLLANGANERQIDSLSKEIKRRMEKSNTEPKGVEGTPNSGWVLLDYGDLIINIFNKEQREIYQLEKIWGDGRVVDTEV